MNQNKLVLLITLFAVLCLGAQPAQAVVIPSATFCRFGIGVVKGLSGYDLSLIGAGSYLDWGTYRNSQVPSAIQYFHVVGVSDRIYARSLTELPARLIANPRAIWIIGNEPDSEVTFQDNITAEVYAQRYYELASIIRASDPNAVIGFGTIIQATPIRLYYLKKSLEHLDSLTGNRSATAAIIDVLTIHNFILNEEPIYKDGVAVNWGAGVPRGYIPGVWPEPDVITIGGPIDETAKTHSSTVFEERIRAFRTWMIEQELLNKPLWVTEYGSLFPAISAQFLTVGDDKVVEFMQQTMDFMLSAKDNSGYALDENRLVQHFTWYSLNEDRWRFGGSLYDPSDKRITLVGERFISYEPPASAAIPRKQADLYVLPNMLRVAPIGRSGTDLVNYRVNVRASNSIPSEYRTQMVARLYVDDVLVEESSITYLPRCSGQAELAFNLMARQPGEQVSLRVQTILINGNGPEINPDNDNHSFPIFTLPPIYQLHMPIFHINP
jgi:hypothetical protein